MLGGSPPGFLVSCHTPSDPISPSSRAAARLARPLNRPLALPWRGHPRSLFSQFLTRRFPPHPPRQRVLPFRQRPGRGALLFFAFLHGHPCEAAVSIC